MRAFDTPLPIDEALPGLLSALAKRPSAVLVAPPGAGKTTRVPLALLDEGWATLAGKPGRIIVLEPRRLAARAAAERMASTLGEKVGDTVGLRVRLGSQIGPRTRIEEVTEGVFARMILDDPELSGVAAVLFDEYHERSLDADLGLAFALDAQAGLRDDLRILVMSATLDGARVARLLGDAPVIASEGRAWPVETRHVGRDSRRRIEEEVADTVLRTLRAEPGSVLVFLPGQGEIRRTETLLRERVTDPAVDIAPLYGAMDQRAQDLAVKPAAPGRRKVVLATSIAETSLTIEGVRVVVDSGLARVPRYEPAIGLTRLETVKVSRAGADQRRGRAGRTEPGVCYRLWEEAATGSLEAFARPEILAADLSGLVLDCAAWGVTDPTRLSFLDPPPGPALAEAKVLLRELDAIEADGRLTAEGRAIRDLPLPPRLARMVVVATRRGEGALAAEIAAVITERGLGGEGTSLVHRIEGFRRDRSRRADDMRRLARGWARGETGDPASAGRVLALAYPDRVAKARGGTGAFLMANGRGASVEAHDALAREPFLAVAEIAGSAGNARILLAAPLSAADIDEDFAGHIVNRDELVFDRSAAALRARRVRRLEAFVLAEQTRPVPATPEAARLLAEGIVSLGIGRLPWSKAQQQWRARVMFMRRADPAFPDLSDEALATNAAEWLAPFLEGKSSLAQIGADDLDQALRALLPWDLARRLEAECPTHCEAPTGPRHAIDYEAEEGPVLAIRVQELFGLREHPSVAGGRLPLVLHLLSPAHRPIQITRDLPGFWQGSWSAVKAEMKGRYPRHPWPDDPASAAPTTRAKPRGTCRLRARAGRFFPFSPCGRRWTAAGGPDEGSSERWERPPHLPLRGTFSRKGRRGEPASCFARLLPPRAVAGDDEVGGGGIAGHRDVVDQSEAGEGLHVDIVRVRRERVDEEDEPVQLAFRDQGADLLVAAHGAALHQADAQLRAALQDARSGRACGDEVAGGEVGAVALRPVHHGRLLLVMRDQRQAKAGHGGAQLPQRCCQERSPKRQELLCDPACAGMTRAGHSVIGASAISSRILVRIASMNCERSRMGITNAPGPPITQSV
jgi:ATP-dependent helicase HrpB